jgi:integrase/recombinase XerD
MAPLPQIELERLTYKGEKVIALRFPYDVMLTQWVKSAGARWSTGINAWRIHDDKSSRDKLMETMRGKAWLVWPKRETKKRDREGVSKQLNTTLIPAQTEDLERAMRLIRAKGLSPRTQEIYQSLIERFLKYTGKSGRQIDQETIIHFQSEHLIKGGYAESTQRQFVTAIHYFIEANQLAQVELAKVTGPRKAKALPKVFTRDEVMMILAACGNLKHRAILSLLYSTGLRVGEMLELRLTDIRWDSNALVVSRAKGRKDRMVMMGEQMSVLLRNYILQFRPQQYLFNGRAGMKYTQTSVRAVLQKACLRSGIRKKATPHMLRHSFATHMIEEGVNLRYVQSLLGHTRPETTQIYTHVATEHLMRLKNPFDELMKQYGSAIGPGNDLTNGIQISRPFDDVD